METHFTRTMARREKREFAGGSGDVARVQELPPACATSYRELPLTAEHCGL